MKYGDFQFIITRAERQFQFIEQQVHLKLSHLSLSAVDDARMHWLSPFLNPDHIHVTLVLPITVNKEKAIKELYQNWYFKSQTWD